MCWIALLLLLFLLVFFFFFFLFFFFFQLEPKLKAKLKPKLNQQKTKTKTKQNKNKQTNKQTNKTTGDKGCSLIRVAYSTIILLSRLDSLFLCRLYQSFLIQLWKRLQSHDTQVITRTQLITIIPVSLSHHHHHHHHHHQQQKTGKLMTRDTSEKSVKMEIKRSGDSLARV